MLRAFQEVNLRMLRATSRAGQFSATIAKILSSPFPGRITCGLFNQMPLLSHLPQIITFFEYGKVIGKTWLAYYPVCLFVCLFVQVKIGHIYMVYLGELMTRTNDPMQSPIFSQGPLPIVKFESTCETFRMMIMMALLMTMVAMVAMDL